MSCNLTIDSGSVIEQMPFVIEHLGMVKKEFNLPVIEYGEGILCTFFKKYRKVESAGAEGACGKVIL